MWVETVSALESFCTQLKNEVFYIHSALVAC